MTEAYAPLTISLDPSSDTASIAQDHHPLAQVLLRAGYGNAFKQLALLATWFNKPDGEKLAIAVAEKALEFAPFSFPILDRHFGFANLCIVFYRWRDVVPGALDSAVAACKACIAIQDQAAAEAVIAFGMIPAHHCFRQLRIIEEKRGNYDEAICIVEQAKAGGWADDWDRDIVRLRKKLQRSARNGNLPA